MKTLKGGLQRRFIVARLAVCTLLIAATTLGLTTPGKAADIITHSEIIFRS